MSVFDIIVSVLTLLGSLCLFLFGIKMLSDSLQRVAGNKMRSILYKMTSNRFKGVITGFLITTVIQSSSASTVMVISFVNAGLMSLTGAIGVIMGANIGTTVTAWIISILGFKVSMFKLSLPLMGICLPLLFSKNEKNKSIAELVIGFGLLFIGLQFLQDNLQSIFVGDGSPDSVPRALEFVSSYTNGGFGSILLFVFIGMIITMLIQSSSAAMALTLTLCFTGLMPFECAAAMVLGQNIGTTITANIAALVGNNSARSAALAHLLFNVFGVILALIFFNPSLRIIDSFMQTSSGVSVLNGNLSDPNVRVAITIALSIFHTVFNVANTLILIWFTDQIAELVIWMIKDKDSDEEFRLKYISQGLVNTSELATIQAKKEIVFMAQRVQTMIEMLPNLLLETHEKEIENLSARMQKYEEISDRMQLEITKYLVNIPQHGEMSKAVSNRVMAMLKIIDDIERIGDRCYQFYKVIVFKNQKRIKFTTIMNDDLLRMIDTVDKASNNMINNLSDDYHSISMTKGNLIEQQINAIRDELKNKNAEMLKNNYDEFTVCNVFSELFSTCERTGDIIQNVNESIATCKD